MSRSIHPLLFVSLTILLLAAPLGAAPSPPPDSELAQPSPSLLDAFLTFLSNLVAVDATAEVALDASTSSGGNVTNSGSCIDPLGCPK